MQSRVCQRDISGVCNFCKKVVKDSCKKKLEEIAPVDIINWLMGVYSKLKVNYIVRVLTYEEIKAIYDPLDILILARIKRMKTDRLKHFDHFTPINKEEFKKYIAVQVSWMEEEKWFLGNRLHRCPTQKEIAEDFVASNNGLRFRAYYCLKYPERMQHNGKCEICKP